MKLIPKIIVALLITCSLSVFAEDATAYKFYGFVRSDFYSDSRKIYSTSQDLFSFYPMYKDLNVAGEDLNALSSASLMSITTRMGLDFSTSTGLFGAQKAVAKIETDFGGSPTYMLLRIRQAYSQILWDHSSLLVGQTWHPLFANGTQPSVLSLNAGALFQPFNRSPQVRYDYQLKDFKLTAAAVYQMQYTSQGPDETTPTKTVSSYAYQRNARIPDMYVSIEYRKNNLLVGLGADYKSIMPTRYVTDLSDNVTHVNHRLLSTPAFMLYGVYTTGKLTVKAKALVGQNLVDQNIIGGYVITLDNKYIPYNSMSSYIHFNYGKTHQVGLLVGYTANLGPSSTIPLGSYFYGFGVANANTATEKMIDNIYRITPSYTYNYKNWKLGTELEYTNAAWGNRSAANGNILSLKRVDNYRIYAILAYTF
jgi:hypothetical protein